MSAGTTSVVTIVTKAQSARTRASRDLGIADYMTDANVEMDRSADNRYWTDRTHRRKAKERREGCRPRSEFHLFIRFFGGRFKKIEARPSLENSSLNCINVYTVQAQSFSTYIMKGEPICFEAKKSADAERTPLFIGNTDEWSGYGREKWKNVHSIWGEGGKKPNHCKCDQNNTRRATRGRESIFFFPL